MPEFNVSSLSFVDWASWVLIVGGVFFAITGAIGMIRLPDVFSRMHGAGMVDTLGAGLILVGLMFQTSEWIIIVKLGLILVFITFTSPTTTFALSRAAINGGIEPGPKRKANNTDDKDQSSSNT